MLSRITYNAPVVLSFALGSVAVLLLRPLLPADLGMILFSAPGRAGAQWLEPLTWLRLASHVLGHLDWTHLTNNFFLILLLGPLLEEKYGSRGLLIMIILTALAAGVVNALFMGTAVMGASGIVFMMIVLSAFTDFRSGQIPLTFLLVAGIFLSGEILMVWRDDQVSRLSHILGGLAGSAFGYWGGPVGRK